MSVDLCSDYLEFFNGTELNSVQIKPHVCHLRDVSLNVYECQTHLEITACV